MFLNRRITFIVRDQDDCDSARHSSSSDTCSIVRRPNANDRPPVSPRIRTLQPIHDKIRAEGVSSPEGVKPEPLSALEHCEPPRSCEAAPTILSAHPVVA